MNVNSIYLNVQTHATDRPIGRAANNDYFHFKWNDQRETENLSWHIQMPSATLKDNGEQKTKRKKRASTAQHSGN